MGTKKEQAVLWEECKSVFAQARNNKTDKLLKAIIDIVKKYDCILSEVADNDFLDYITHMDSSNFITGTNDDNYELILSKYLNIEECNLEDIWRILSQLVWDISTVVSNNVCPNCNGDHLAYYTDKTNTHLYESCLGCFSTWENSNLTKRPEETFPASKTVLNKFRIF